MDDRGNVDDGLFLVRSCSLLWCFDVVDVGIVENVDVGLIMTVLDVFSLARSSCR